MGLSATPSRPACPSRASSWSCARPRHGASRVASVFLFHACHRHYPGGIMDCASLSSPMTAAFPVKWPGRLPHHLFSRPAQRSLTLRPACSPSPLWTFYTRGFSRFVAFTTALIATGWSESCRAGFAPAEKTAPLHGAPFYLQQKPDSASSRQGLKDPSGRRQIR
jgi:hypothetical protein